MDDFDCSCLVLSSTEVMATQAKRGNLYIGLAEVAKGDHWIIELTRK
jgi:tmRNA-binding protein